RFSGGAGLFFKGSLLQFNSPSRSCFCPELAPLKCAGSRTAIINLNIIIFPEVSQTIIDEAKAKIDTIRSEINKGNIDFATAARQYSDEKETRNNGGQLVNPVSFDTRFDLTKMEPTLSAQVYNLKEKEISKVYRDRDRTGRSKFKILTVTKKNEEHPADFQKDYEKIKDLALKQKQIRAIEKWQNKKIKSTYVNVNQDYYDCEFSSNWIKN
ncbi:MAG: peptidylprolyl isomerase, partial [Flavobacteriaceae bacterium]|nr:peptidylprolyl isomerase [Flavobacteriaceae bacterium]